LVAASNLSKRYITERFLPDKAIDLMDEAAAKLKIEVGSLPSELRNMEIELQRLSDEEESASERSDYEKAATSKTEHARLKRKYAKHRKEFLDEHNIDMVVRDENIAELIAQRTGIAVTRLVEGESERLLHLEGQLHHRVIGQDPAVSALSDAIRRARAGLKDPKRPIGSFIFLGPTGVGKTELARALAEYLFDDEDNMVRVDMSEYQESHTISRLIGSPPGYVGYDQGGQLTEAVRRHPFRVVLFDEIEKANPEVFNTLLQVMEDGCLTDGHGRTVDFRNTVIIMTSNLGTEDVAREAIGFTNSIASETEAERRRVNVENALKKTFRPEFLNRIDEIIIFDPLSEGDIDRIVDLMVVEVGDRVAETGVTIQLTSAASSWLAKEGFDRVFGARPLRRVIQRHIENALAKRILSGEFSDGSIVEIDAGEDGLVFNQVRASVDSGTEQIKLAVGS
jgi:ATP-dependent Clp protease ATP-binding subunit ClpC